MSSGTEQWTILRLLEWTTEYLESAGSDTARLDAEILLAEARGCKRIDLYTAFGELASDEVRTAFRELVRRRSEGTPVAYLTGHREFYSRDFCVTPDVLIPRPETEFIITTMLDLSGSDRNVQRTIADVGTGSGILAVCAAAELPKAQITATDLSPQAIEVAKRNATTHQVDDRITFLQTDIMESIPVGPTFDFVLSNPPYVSEPEFEELDRTVKDFEPKMALVGGPTGAEIIERLVVQAALRLKLESSLIVEISPMIEKQVHALFQQHGQFGPPETVRDLAGHARIVHAKRV